MGTGDQQAFNELYDRYYQRLYYYFFRMLGSSKEMANDFLQELFLKIIEKQEHFDPRYEFRTWIFSIAHNLCKNEYRRRDVRRNIPLPETDQTDPVSPGNISRDELVDRIFKNLDQLTEEQKSVFLMHYREGFRINEISEVLDLSPGTVKSRLFYARKFLADKLQYLKDEIDIN